MGKAEVFGYESPTYIPKIRASLLRVFQTDGKKASSTNFCFVLVVGGLPIAASGSLFQTKCDPDRPNGGNTNSYEAFNGKGTLLNWLFLHPCV